jgi:pyridinium-3,5-biscarboxylic acid mononucleotide sulfurtransferase
VDIQDWFREKGSALVALSGGVDSSVLAALAYNALAKKAVAVTLQNECMPRSELETAKTIARDIGIEHIILRFSQLDIPGFKENPKERCYICKKEIANFLKRKTDELGLAVVCDGVSVSDLDEYRPGIRASDEEGVLHPFLENGLRKRDIRKSAKELGLRNANAPSSACLASRFPYGFEINTALIKQIDAAEEHLRSLRLNQVRVRLIDANSVRIETDETENLLKLDLKSIKRKLNELGFDEVCIDLNGYNPSGIENGKDLRNRGLLQI